MTPSQMLYEMCHDVLSAADVKAICKSRTFSDREADSRSLFEHVFLSSIGVEDAMDTLTAAEAATLHLLRMEDRVVDVTFFKRLYGGKQAGLYAYGTFTQQYKPIYDAVQRNLVRKGLLIIAAARTNSPDRTKMELWRYRFPSEFGPFLPPLVQPRVHDGQPCSVHADNVRIELRRLVQDRAPVPRRPGAIQLAAGGLTIGLRPFSATAVRDWRQAAWEWDIQKATVQQKNELSQGAGQDAMYTGYLLPNGEYRKPSPLPAVLYGLSRLAPDEWISPDQLDVLLDILYAGAGHPSSETICQTGWDNGCLVRHQADGFDVYRVAGDAHTPAHDAPETYLPLPTADGRMFVDLDTVPYEALEILGRIATFRIEDGRLWVTPGVAKIVDALDAVRDQPVVHYLKTHNAEFRAALKRIDAQWGKLIVHENLLVARVRDLSLRVKLQQTFEGADGAPSAQLVFLSDEYVAFPRAMMGDIEKLVKKAGHVIKTVGAR